MYLYFCSFCCPSFLPSYCSKIFLSSPFCLKNFKLTNFNPLWGSLLVINQSSHLSYENLYFPLINENEFHKKSWLTLFSFSSWKICHFLLIFMVLDEKSAVIRIGVTIQVMCHFSVPFQAFFFVVTFQKSNYTIVQCGLFWEGVSFEVFSDSGKFLAKVLFKQCFNTTMFLLSFWNSNDTNV